MNGQLYQQWLLDASWLFFLIGVFCYFWHKRKQFKNAESWLHTKGYISQCTWNQSGHTVWPQIKYHYQVYDCDLCGQHIFLDTIYYTPSSKYARQIAYKAAIAFQNKQEIEVYYNPNIPEQSALDISIPKKLNSIIALIGSVLLLHVVMILWHFL